MYPYFVLWIANCFSPWARTSHQRFSPSPYPWSTFPLGGIEWVRAVVKAGAGGGSRNRCTWWHSISHDNTLVESSSLAFQAWLRWKYSICWKWVPVRALHIFTRKANIYTLLPWLISLNTGILFYSVWFGLGFPHGAGSSLGDIQKSVQLVRYLQVFCISFK